MVLIDGPGFSVPAQTNRPTGAGISRPTPVQYPGRGVAAVAPGRELFVLPGVIDKIGGLQGTRSERSEKSERIAARRSIRIEVSGSLRDPDPSANPTKSPCRDVLPTIVIDPAGGVPSA